MVRFIDSSTSLRASNLFSSSFYRYRNHLHRADVRESMLAVLLVATVESPGFVLDISSRPYGERVVLKLSQY